MAMRESLTVVIQTSPIPSHPSTALLEALFRSFEKADGLLESRIIILADGCQTLDEDENNGRNAVENIKHGKCHNKTAENYRCHLKRLEKLVREQNPPFRPHAGGSIELIQLEKRHGSAPAIQAAMTRFVSTPLVMICQHDNFFVNEAPVREIVNALLDEPRGLGIGANCIHFLSTATLNYREKIRRRYKLDVGEPLKVKNLTDPLVPLVFWYGRSHVTYSNYVRSYCLNRPLAQGSHLEELLGEKQLHDILKKGIGAHKAYGTYVLDQNNTEVLYHMSGRRVRAANLEEVKTKADIQSSQAEATSETSKAKVQPLEGSFTTARETIAKVPGLAFIASEPGDKARKGGQKAFKQRCFHCGEKGHSKKFCPKRELSVLRDRSADIIEL